ncbi:hypothetical protein RIEGSTA812A_PEG_272 [invertebrate metagenome]|uniref:Uncharacterized protein n=1 Tax=invertebrate metagenome TaxID=1711999 RepID=A0A484H4T0_9ZZZZ
MQTLNFFLNPEFLTFEVRQKRAIGQRPIIFSRNRGFQFCVLGTQRCEAGLHTHHNPPLSIAISYYAHSNTVLPESLS